MYVPERGKDSKKYQRKLQIAMSCVVFSPCVVPTVCVCFVLVFLAILCSQPSLSQFHEPYRANQIYFSYHNNNKKTFEGYETAFHGI
jgi:hypothetical protein